VVAAAAAPRELPQGWQQLHGEQRGGWGPRGQDDFEDGSGYGMAEYEPPGA
jgi:hypothetical protein